MKKSILLVIICALFSSELFSNGGPIVNSQVLKTKQIQLINNDRIKITDEKININFDGEYAIYDITYSLTREFHYGVDTVLYGFPVDFIQLYYDDWKFNNEDLPYFEMYFNDEKLNLDEHIDYSLFQDSVIVKNGEKNRDVLNSTIYGFPTQVSKRKWYIAQLIFDSDKTYKLNVKYKVRNYSVDFATSKSTFISYDTRKLIYDFSPAAYWGDGIIDNMTINIDVSNIDSNFETHNVIGLEGCSFKDGIYSFHQEKFDPEKNKYLVFEYSYETRGLSENIIQNNISKIAAHSLKSSTHCKNINFLEDTNVTTACILKQSNSEKAYIKYAFKNWTYFSDITILNGNYANENDYYDYSRMKKIRIEYDLRHCDDTFKIINIDTIIYLEDKKYHSLNKENFAANADIINVSENYFLSVKNFKITILETYDGRKNNDICISEIFFNGFLWKNY